jgi:hypothetical protein
VIPRKHVNRRILAMGCWYVSSALAKSVIPRKHVNRRILETLQHPEVIPRKGVESWTSFTFWSVCLKGDPEKGS